MSSLLFIHVKSLKFLAVFPSPENSYCTYQGVISVKKGGVTDTIIWGLGESLFIRTSVGNPHSNVCFPSKVNVSRYEICYFG